MKYKEESFVTNLTDIPGVVLKRILHDEKNKFFILLDPFLVKDLIKIIWNYHTNFLHELCAAHEKISFSKRWILQYCQWWIYPRDPASLTLLEYTHLLTEYILPFVNLYPKARLLNSRYRNALNLRIEECTLTLKGGDSSRNATFLIFLRLGHLIVKKTQDDFLEVNGHKFSTLGELVNFIIVNNQTLVYDNFHYLF